MLIHRCVIIYNNLSFMNEIKKLRELKENVEYIE